MWNKVLKFCIFSLITKKYGVLERYSCLEIFCMEEKCTFLVVRITQKQFILEIALKIVQMLQFATSNCLLYFITVK